MKQIIAFWVEWNTFCRPKNIFWLHCFSPKSGKSLSHFDLHFFFLGILVQQPHQKIPYSFSSGPFILAKSFS